MAYTNIDDPSAHFQTALYTGNGNATNAITNDGNSDLQPDFVWVKRREGASDHVLQDSSRGFTATTKLASSSNQHENDTDSGGSFGITDPKWGYVSSASSDGFNANVGTGTGDQVNKTSSTFVGWQWKANGGTTASNTSGTINSTVQVNQDAGFSIGTYTGNGSTADQNVGHGLGVRPNCVIVKNRTAAANWVVYIDGLVVNHSLELNTSDTQSDSTAGRVLATTAGSYGTSSIFTLRVGGGSVVQTNTNNQNYVFYAWAEKQGYSKFGSYVGNGNANGPFVYTGFKPAFVMIKVTSAVESWTMFDGARKPFNRDDNVASLYANTSGAEYTGASYHNIDILSNGFKVRLTNTAVNASGASYIYMAFAENPFVTSTGIPTTAR